MAPATEYASPPPPAFPQSPPSLSLARSPDTASPIFPERAIRPLPKSRLKSKLSPDQVSSIVYPPDPPPVSPTLSLSAPDPALASVAGHRAVNGDATYGGYLHHRAHIYEAEHDHCTCGDDGDSGDDEVEFDHPDYRYSTAPHVAAGATVAADGAHRQQLAPAKAALSASAASSADGYESFENTSNKKKRKIPLSGTSSLHQSQLSADMASMGISGGAVDGAADDVHGGGAGGRAVQHAYGGASGGTGISGAGRGRYGKQNVRGDHSARRPLASSNNMNAHGYNSRLPAKNGLEIKTNVDAGIENTQTGGIISQAIKSAAENPVTPQKGQESSSLLSSATSSATPSNSTTQFTFAVESESASKLVGQQAASYASPSPSGRAVNGVAGQGRAGSMSTQGTQTGPVRGGSQSGAGGIPAAGRPPAPGPPSGQQAPPAPPPAPKPRRRPSKEYALSARQRRLQQEYTNFHHRPTPDNMWICEFCEYEDIFGVPPVALIRQYEIKDREERKRAAEKRRLLEKARAKGRKNKKGGKNGKNGAHSGSAAGGTPQDAHYDPNLPPEGDEYYEDEYEGDDYDPVGGADGEYAADYYPPPPPSGTPQALGTALAAGDGGGTAEAVG